MAVSTRRLQTQRWTATFAGSLELPGSSGLPAALLWLAWHSTIPRAAARLALCHAQLLVNPF